MKIDESVKKSKESVSRLHPFAATLLEIRSLNPPGSTKENLHVTLDIEGSGIEYQVGSSFGLYPENCPDTLEQLLKILGCREDHIVYDKKQGGAITARAFFAKKVNLLKVTSAHLNLIDQWAPSDPLKQILSSKESLLAYTQTTDLMSFLDQFWNPSIDLQLLCDVCAPLLPRYYSVASSQKVAKNRVDLMIASFSYQMGAKEQKSTMASFLKERCQPNVTKIPLFLMENPHFSLPQDRHTKVILIGPGTGLAALRGFLQERYHQNPHLGGNWLFTGDRHRKTDFHYEEELTEWENSGFLKLSLAFSRDGETKHYVQDEMKREAKEFWRWIEEGAHIYLCGDAKCMARDVMQTLHEIALTEGNLTEEEAKALFRKLKKEKRLCQDVY